MKALVWLQIEISDLALKKSLISMKWIHILVHFKRS